MSVRVNFAFEKSEICIENSTKLISSNYFSIQLSIENHLPTKERRQARSDKLRDDNSESWVVSFVMLNSFQHLHQLKLRPWNKFRVTSIENSVKPKGDISGELWEVSWNNFELLIKNFELKKCQFEWILLLKKVKFVSRTRLNVKLQTTSRYNFLSKITCLPRNAGRLEVTASK